MAKVDQLQDVLSSYAAVAVINDNTEKIEEAFDNTLSRDGTTPNQMEAALDMNHYAIENIGPPTGPNSVARLSDLIDYVEVEDGFADLLATTTGAGLVGSVQSGTGAVSRTVQVKLRDALFIKDFGAVGDDTANDSAAFALATTEQIASGKTLILTAGTYKLGSSWNAITVSHQRVIALGKVILHFTGAGVGVKIDGGAATAVYDTTFGGEIPIEIKGNVLTTDALYSRSNHHSRINVNVRDCVTGVRQVWNVCTDLRIICSLNEGAFAVLTPTNGLLMEERTAGEYCAANNIYPIIEGVSGSGIKGAVGGAGFNNIWGGTSEVNAVGLEWSDGCNYNNVIGTDLEQNTVQDIADSGKGNRYFGLESQSTGSSPSVDMIASQGASFHGCKLRVVNLQGTSRDTAFFSCGFSDNVALGVTGTGTYKMYSCYEVDTDGEITVTLPDKLGTLTTWTPSVAQGGAVAATVNIASYINNAGIINGIAILTLSAAGTAGQAIIVGGIPAGMLPINFGADTILGTAYVLDNGTTTYAGVVKRLSNTEVTINVNGSLDYLGATPSFALASGDKISLLLNYRGG